MKHIFFLPVIITLLLVIPLSVDAQIIKGKNFDDVFIGETNNGYLYERSFYSYDRILHNGQYKDYIFTETPFYKEIAKSGSALRIDKNTCKASYFSGGVVGGKSPLFADDIIPFQSIVNLFSFNKMTSLDNAPCITGWNGSELTATKIVNGTGAITYAYIDDNGRWKTELRVTNLSSLTNRVFGFDQVVDLNRDTIKFGGIVRNLDQYNGTTFDKTFLTNNGAKVIDLLNGNVFDFDIAFDDLDSITVYDTGVNSSQLIFHYRTNDVILPNQTLILDPEFIDTSSSGGRVTSGTGSTGGACPDVYSTTDGSLYIQRTTSATTQGCMVLYIEWDVSNLSGIVNSIDIEYDVLQAINSPPTCEWRELSTNPPDGQTTWDDGFDTGTVFLTGDTTCQTVADGKNITLNSAAITSLQDAINSSQTWWGVGVFYTDKTRDGTERTTQFRANDAVLTVQYTSPRIPDPPSTLSSDGDATTVTLWFDPPTFDGINNDASLIEDYHIFRQNGTTFTYFQQPLPNSGGQDFNYSQAFTGRIDMSGNDLLFHFDEIVNATDLNVNAFNDKSGNEINATGYSTSSGLIFSDDYSTSTGWTTTGTKISITGGEVLANDIGTNAEHRIHKSLGSTLSDSSWFAYFDFEITAQFSTGFPFCLAAGTSGTPESASQDSLCFVVDNTNWLLSSKDGASAMDYSTSSAISTSTPYCVELSRTSTTNLRGELFNGPCSSKGSQVGSTKDKTIPSTVQSLTHLHHSSYSTGGGPSGQTWTVDNSFVCESSSNCGSGVELVLNSNAVIGSSVSTLPLNFTTTENLIEGTNNFQMGAWIRNNQTTNLDLINYNVSGSNPTSIGIDSSNIYVKDNGASIASKAHSCNTGSWCHISVKRSGSTFTFYENGTSLGTATASDNLGTALNDEFFIGTSSSSITASIDEFFINPSFSDTDTSNIFKRGDSDTYTWNYVSAIGNTTSTVITALQTGIDYIFGVKSDNGVYNSTSFALTEVTTSTVNPPTSLTATAVSNTQINLEWVAPTDGDTPNGYKIERESPVGGGFSTLVANTTNILLYYNNTGLTTATQYNYRVYSLNGTNESIASNQANATTCGVPSQVTGLSVGTPTKDSLTLTWSTPSNNCYTITGYKIERESPVGGGFSTLVANTGSTSTTYVNTGLSTVTEYNYKVSAINSQGTGAASAESSGTTLSNPPTSLTVNDCYHTCTTQLNLEWVAPVPSTGVNGYKIERESPVGGGFSTLVANTTTTTLYYNNTGLITGTVYNYRVTALTPDGESEASNTYSYSPHKLPDAITDLVATATSLSTIQLTWSQPTIYFSTVSGYNINFTTPEGDPLTILSSNTGSSSTSYLVSGVVGSTNSFRVSAVTPHGTNGSGNIANATVVSEFIIGSLDFPSESNTSILPIRFTESDYNSTTVDVNVIFPNTVTSLRCDIDYLNSQTNTTHTGMSTTVYDASYNNVTLRFVNANDEVINIDCYDSTDTTITGSHQVQQSSFPFKEYIDNFRNGDYGTLGIIGTLDLITLIVITVSMVAFNKENPAVGLLVATMILGGAAFFEIIELETTLFGALVLVVMLAIVITKKRS